MKETDEKQKKAIGNTIVREIAGAWYCKAERVLMIIFTNRAEVSAYRRTDQLLI